MPYLDKNRQRAAELARCRRAQIYCRHCGKQIVSTAYRPGTSRKFCSPSCWYQSQHKTRTAKCEVCGNEFDNSRRRYNRTCSQSCGGILRRKRAKRTCEICKKEFEYHTCRNQMVRFCSRACYHIGQRSIDRPPRDGEWFLMRCSGCGHEFRAHTRKRSRFGGRRFCSKRCFGKANRGVNNALYRGNGRPRNYIGALWERRRRQAVKRDGRCQYSCDQTKKLCVDHIIPFRLHQSHDLVNLMCLCRAHHSVKTMAERHLLKGDRLSFERILNEAGCPKERLLEAFMWWGTKPQIKLDLRRVGVA